MTKRQHLDTLRWLQTKPGLAELCARFPDEWRAVETDLADLVARRDFQQLHSRIQSLSTTPSLTRKLRGGNNAIDAMAAVRRRMFLLAIKHYSLTIATGGKSGRVRFGLISGMLAQWLFFAGDFERKPVPLWRFCCIWPLIRQKSLLMPLVETKGIYCFYSQELIDALAKLIGGRSCLEIGAGDGSLSRFLATAGCQVTATDNYSWEHRVSYSSHVQKMDAADALVRFNPEVVVCSWPPAGNPFERQIFQTPSVQLYIMIGSCHRMATGNWDVYERQTRFTRELDPELSALVLPPEAGPAVYIFRRNPEDAKG